MNHSPQVKDDPRRGIPSVDQLSRQLGAEFPALPAWAVTFAVREILKEIRNSFESGALDPKASAGLGQRAAHLARLLAAPKPQRVINATGVVLHTNLGRAPLAAAAVEAATRAGEAYSDLELDLGDGRRGDRQAAVTQKITALTGAASALVVNNNAAAVLLAVNTLALGREVIVSRGELVEIGGSFRVPDILARAGVRLVEVGTTNRTHLRDYAQAIGPDTGCILKVHPSNFEQRGFVTDVSLQELSGLARECELPLVEDLGSATLIDLRDRGLPQESFAAESLRRGADLVCFSGDKLLGGPQAGIAIGREDLVRDLRRNPLARVLRIDKLSLAALDATLAILLEGRGEQDIPALARLLEPEEVTESRARALAAAIEKAVGDRLAVSVRRESGAVGGGSLPEFSLQSFVVALEAEEGANALSDAFRSAPVPILARVRDGAVWLDVRTLLDGDAEEIESTLVRYIQRSSD